MEFLFVLLVSYSKNYNSGDMLLSIILLSFLVIPFCFIIIGGLFDVDKLFLDIKKYSYKKIYGKYQIHKIPDGLHYIIYSFGIKPKEVTKISKITQKRFKKVNTNFAYEIKTGYNNKFHLYLDKNKSDGEHWLIYIRKHFDNKPIRVKDNYFDIMKIVNNDTFDEIKNRLHSRLDDHLSLKELTIGF